MMKQCKMYLSVLVKFCITANWLNGCQLFFKMYITFMKGRDYIDILAVSVNKIIILEWLEIKCNH